MSNKDKTPLVPKLRFPTFEQSWESTPLGELGKFFRGLTYGADDVADGGLLVLRSSNIQGGQLILDSDLVFVTRQCPPELRLKRGDLAICMSNGSKALVGKSGELNQDYPGELTVGAFCSIFRPATPFAKIAFSTQRYENFVATGIAGGNINNLKNSDLESFEFHVPPSSGEQQKIADCLSSLNELIAAQVRKVDALKTHKKGLMQQLFPREGETQPRLRFPEFRGAGDWESKLLSDLVKSFKTGKLDANAMVEGGQYRFYTCAKNYYQIDNFAFDGEALLVAGNGAHLGYIHHYIGKFNAYQRTYVLQKFKANVVFLRCLLDRFLPARILFEKKDGNTPYIVLATLTEMPLMIPTDPEEQKCIADCLTSLDTLITAAIQELDTLKTHKKGLMQQLFPSAEAAEV